MSRTLLFLSSESFRAFTWKNSDMSLASEFPNDAGGREQFSNFLDRHPHPACLLVDIIEEDFHQETVPHLHGSNRSALLDRKYEQYYRTTPFRQATLLQRQAEGRRDDEMLFSALTNPKRITPWLDTLLTKHIPLIGIYSVPNISTPLLKDIASEHVLLLSWEKSSGLRQTYFNNKKLYFSRLTAINDSGSFIDSVAEETPRTQQFLKSRSLPPPGEVLDVHIICHAKDRAGLHSKLPGNDNLHYTYLDIEELGRRRNSKHNFTDSDATPLFLNLLATNAPSTNYANSDHTHFYLLWQLRRIFYGLAVAAMLTSLSWSAITFWQGRELVAEIEPIRAQTARFQQLGQEVQGKYGSTITSAADMKTSVMLARNLSDYTPTPKALLSELSAVMGDFPRINLNKLAWQSSAAEAAPSRYPAQVITFEGELTGFGNDYRKSLDYVKRFQQALTQRGYVVSALTLPLDISSKGSLSGEDQANAGKPAQFTLKIIWRHPA
jgi:hypothetical protein